MNSNWRAFKTSWFAKEAKRNKISDTELCSALRQLMLGQGDDLGGGVFKKRLNDNMHRSIVLTKAGEMWIYAYLFAKKDRANIAVNELAEFKKLAKAYAKMTNVELDKAITNQDLWEICHDC
jgi:hypothetical protein